MKSGLELEIRQSYLYFCTLLIISYITSYLLLCVFLFSWIIATLEELDPEDVESEEELWPFLEFTYIETMWKKGNHLIKIEEKKENEKIEKITPKQKINDWLGKNELRWNIKKLNNLKLEKNKKLENAIILNDIGTLKSTFI